MDDLVAPTPHEVEVSIFGRGHGESILVHVGDGRWTLVDCLLNQDRSVAPLRYLQSIGVDPAQHLELIVATHWHDDHVDGMSEVYALASRAKLALPLAMPWGEVEALIDSSVSGSSKFSSGVAQLQKIAAIRAEQGRPKFLYANQNNALYRVQGDALAHRRNVLVEALSPSHARVDAFLTRLAQEATSARNNPSARDGKRPLMPFKPNDISVALWVAIGDHRILLGADLENSADPEAGWVSVLSSSAPVSGRAEVHKVPHHGSANAHNDDAWTTLLLPKPLCALTTYNRGVKVPSPADVQRLLGISDRCYVCSVFTKPLKDKPKAVTKTIDERNCIVRPSKKMAGQIRLRLNLENEAAGWSTKLINGAASLSNLYQL